MPQREPARHQTSGEPPGAKVKMRLDKKGRWVAAPPAAEPAPPAEDPERRAGADGARLRPPAGSRERP